MAFADEQSRALSFDNSLIAGSQIEVAQQVDDEHVCASCLADYFRRVFNAIRERVSYHLVLDDPATILRLAESEGACDAFYEAVVVRRVEAEGVYHDVVRRGCNLCAALRGEACRVEGVN